ncbi:MmcQ-like protein [candidate division KSB3 bacterium]|uniref:MmcQ-like protein n=1 Tax=candidate division KSB3 bacterium TaxID=2044937 RepID=A0A2G6KDT5_9BACT|nr:MAG: MmcQ-like protein [candidate division KSB3 bacterium]
MELETLRQYMQKKKGTTEEIPFGPEALVFKVLGKMYALIAWQETPLRISLKCDPDHALALRDIYESVIPGYHFNKKHWNTIILDGSVPEREVLQWIDDSYTLVVKKLKKTDRQSLEM